MSNPKVAEFIQEIAAVCERHQLALSQEADGDYIVVRLSHSYIDSIIEAIDYASPKSPPEPPPPPKTRPVFVRKEDRGWAWYKDRNCTVPFCGDCVSDFIPGERKLRKAPQQTVTKEEPNGIYEFELLDPRFKTYAEVNIVAE